jgi:hypothetical protein
MRWWWCQQQQRRRWPGRQKMDVAAAAVPSRANCVPPFRVRRMLLQPPLLLLSFLHLSCFLSLASKAFPFRLGVTVTVGPHRGS